MLRGSIHTTQTAALAATLLVAAAARSASAQDACSQTTSPSGGTLYTSDGVGSESGDGNHELWHDGGGSMKMTVYGKNAAFKAEWNNAGDFLARVGYRWGDQGKSYTTYGNVYADFNFTKSGTGGGYSYIGIYGWTKSPLVEYYIVENGFWTTPPNAGALGGATSKGTLEVDGGTYDIYTYKRVDKPSIIGNATFDQFWSVRRTPRTCGRISISEHWKKWAAVGMAMGNVYEAKLLVEAGGGQGTFDMKYGTVVVNATSVQETARESAVGSEPRIESGVASWNAGEAGTVSLLTLDGALLRSARQDASTPARLHTRGLPKGVYVIRFQGENSASRTRKLLLD